MWNESENKIHIDEVAIVQNFELKTIKVTI